MTGGQRSPCHIAKQIYKAVKKARRIEEWRSDYMKEMVLLMDAKEEGREEGLEEERSNTEAERRRADGLAAELAKYKAKYGDDL